MSLAHTKNKLDANRIKIDISVGASLYKVYRLGTQCWITKVTVTGYPYVNDIGWWLPIKKYNRYMEEHHHEDMSMQDAGILPNTYNKHTTVNTLAEALKIKREWLSKWNREYVYEGSLQQLMHQAIGAHNHG